MPEQIGPIRQEQESIETIVDDGTHHYLTPSALDVLLENNKVIMFKRSNGWVTVGIHPIRFKVKGEDPFPFDGPDKRSVPISWH